MLGSLFKKLFSSENVEQEESRSLAKSRLHFVLVQDRSGLDQDKLAQFRLEMIKVIKKYFLINEKDFDIQYQRENDTTTLLINSPVVMRREGGKIVASAVAQEVEDGADKAKKSSKSSKSTAKDAKDDNKATSGRMPRKRKRAKKNEAADELDEFGELDLDALDTPQQQAAEG